MWMVVCIHVCSGAHVYMYIQKPEVSVGCCSLGSIHIVFETRSLPGLEPAQAVLFGQGAPESLLSLLFHFRDYKDVPLFLAF